MSKPDHLAHRPRDIADCVSAYLQEGNLDGVVSLFHPDCQIFFPPDQPPRTGLAGVQEAFRDFIGIRPTIKSDLISEVIVGDIALTRANWSVIASDGSIIAQGQSTEVAKRLDNGGWGYLIDCPDGPPELSQ